MAMSLGAFLGEYSLVDLSKHFISFNTAESLTMNESYGKNKPLITYFRKGEKSSNIYYYTYKKMLQRNC